MYNSNFLIHFSKFPTYFYIKIKKSKQINLYLTKNISYLSIKNFYKKYHLKGPDVMQINYDIKR